MLSNTRVPSGRLIWLIGVLLSTAWIAVYLSTVSPTVNFIDSGELITALHEPGVVHPPGYPLYTLMGYVVSHLLPGEVAWRVNALSAFWSALGVGCMYFLVLVISAYTRWLRGRHRAAVSPRRKNEQAADAPESKGVFAWADWTILLSAVVAASLLGAASTYWNRAVQAKMYSLHYFMVMLIILLAVSYRWSYERGDAAASRRWLVATAAALGISFTNHLMTSLLVPGVLVLLFLGSNWRTRVGAALRSSMLALPALVLPLLLYLYLPIRSSQGPVMNWGSPDNLADLWRHVSGWQYRVYFLNDVAISVQRLWGFATSQWGWLTWLVILFCLAAGVLFARANAVVWLATLITAVLTVLFSVAYGISEIEPYQVPLYIMLLAWLGNGPTLLDSLGRDSRPARVQAQEAAGRPYGVIAAGMLALLAVVSAVIQYPRQNHSNDYLAELFVLNTLKFVEPNGIIITDHWDLYAPSYYLQQVRRVRPDVAMIDKSLMRYPWYLGQLEKLHPWLIENSRDLVDAFKVEQRKFVNGEPYDFDRINSLYLNLLSSFVERNYDTHPAYLMLTTPCPSNAPPQMCENNQIAPAYVRQPSGLALRLWREQPPATALPPDPEFDLRGYTYDPAPLDEFARANAGLYMEAYRMAAQAFDTAQRADKAQALFYRTQELQQAMASRQ